MKVSSSSCIFLGFSLSLPDTVTHDDAQKSSRSESLGFLSNQVNQYLGTPFLAKKPFNGCWHFPLNSQMISSMIQELVLIKYRMMMLLKVCRSLVSHVKEM